LLGAAAGAWLIFTFGIGAALGVAFVLLALNSVLAYRKFNSTEQWTVGS